MPSLFHHPYGGQVIDPTMHAIDLLKKLTARHGRLASQLVHLTRPIPGPSKHQQGQDDGYQRFSNMPATCIVQEMLGVRPSPASEYQGDYSQKKTRSFQSLTPVHLCNPPFSPRDFDPDTAVHSV